MGNLVYSMIVSLDGYIEDGDGNFDWAEPREDLHRFFNDMESQSEILMYGRRMYETMSAWETMEDLEGAPSFIKDYSRIWKSKQKIVFSKSLETVITANTVLKKEFVASEIRGIKESTTGCISIGGAEIASHALELDLVDEIQAFVFPVIVGNGKKWIKGARLDRLRLAGMKQFDDDVVMLEYRIQH